MTEEKREESTTPLLGKPASPPTPNLLSNSANVYTSNEQEPSNAGGRQSEVTTFSRSVGNPIISIGLVDQHSFTCECITRSLKELGDSLEVMPFTTSEDCLRNTRDLDLILYHAHQSSGYNDNYDIRLATLKNLLEVAPVIILSEVDTSDSIVEAFESGARGYIPTASTSLELVIEIIRLVRAGGTFVPLSSLSLQSTNRKGPTRGAMASNEFTPRQMAVLGHLTQGKANKAIAHELAMSESTVKVHIRNIMKKMNATNRTEVACRAYAFAEMSGSTRDEYSLQSE